MHVSFEGREEQGPGEGFETWHSSWQGSAEFSAHTKPVGAVVT